MVEETMGGGEREQKEWLRGNKSAWKQSFNRSRESEGKKQLAVIFHCKDQGSDSRDVNKLTAMYGENRSRLCQQR